MADDYSADINTSGKLSVNGKVSGNFEQLYDIDWYKINLVAGTTYVFGLDAAAAGGGTLADPASTYLSLSDSLGAMLTDGYFSQSLAGPVLQFTPATSGDYFLAAHASDTPRGGTYTLKAAVALPDDFAEDSSTTATLLPGVGLAAGFQRVDDIDWFRFHAEAGQSLNFSTVLPISGRGNDVIEVYNAQGERMPVHYQGPFNVNTTGDYYLAVRADDRLGSYTQTMMVLEDDYSWNNARPGMLTAGSEISGAIQFARDIDRINLKVEAGHFYSFSISGEVTWNRFYNKLQDSSGNNISYATVTRSDAAGSSTQLFYAKESDTYSFELGNDINANSYGNYAIKLDVLAADDVGGSAGRAHALALGQTFSGKLDAGNDVEMFRVDLKAGVTYRFKTVVEGGGFLLSTMLDRLLSDVSSGAGRNDFTFTPDSDGAHYLVQTNYGRVQSKSVAYSVSYSTAQDDYGANAASAGRLTPGSEIAGVLEQGGGDVDWHAITLDAGGWYTITLNRNGSGLSQGDTVLRLRDAAGDVVATGSTSGANSLSELTFKAPVGATYYAEVSASNNIGGYLLSARSYGIDDHGNVNTLATVIGEGEALSGKLEIAADKDAFKFSASANTIYAVDVIPAAASADSFKKNAGVAIYHRADQPELYPGKELSKVFMADGSRDYYFVVGSSWNGQAHGDYTVRVQAIGVDDYASTSLTTGRLSTDKPAHGSIDMNGDSDWFKVHLEAKRWYAFELQGAKSGGGTLFTSSQTPSQIRLVDEHGEAAGTRSEVKRGDTRVYTYVDTAGDYFLSIDSLDTTGTYTVVASEFVNDVTGPQLVSSSLQSGAVDVGTMPKIVLTFDEAVRTSSGIKLTDSNGVAVTPPSGQLLAAGYGNTVIIDPLTHLKPGMTYTLSLPEGSLRDLAGNKLVGALNYSFTVTAPVSKGSAGNDYLIGSGRGAVLDGGAGIDTVYYGASKDNHQVTRNSDGTVKVGLSGGSSSDTLTGVERLLFTDGARALDINGIGGQAYRLYQAAFDRTPDSEGIGFWIASMDGGTSLKTVANDFIESAEFTRLYGRNPSDTEFVKLLYNNVLHRDPDAEGYNFWVNGLTNGATRAAILTDFSESAENIAAVATIIGNGFAYTPYG